MVPDKRDNFGRSSRQQDLSQRAKGTDSKSNPQAEQLLIASLLQSATRFYEFSSYLSDSDFTIPEYAQVFYVINQFYSDILDAEDITLTKLEAVANGLGFSNLCGDSMVSELFSVHISPEEDIAQYFYQVKKESIRRLYTDKLFEMGDYLDNTTDQATEIISKIEESVITVSDGLQGDSKELYDLAGGAKKIIYELGENPGSNGLDIGFPIWQN